MKRLLLLLLVTISLSATAQFRPYRDVVYLNDSSVIRGNICFAEPDSTLCVDTKYGCTFVYTKDEVLRYELQPQVRQKGFVLQSGMGIGDVIYYDDMIPLDISWGFKYRTGSLYSVGLNVKNQMFAISAGDYSAASIIQISQRLYLTRKPISPYCELNLGLSLFHQELTNYYYYHHYPFSNGITSFSDFFENALGLFFGGRGTCDVEIGCSIRDLDVALNCGLVFYKHSHVLQTISLKLGYSLPIK